MTALKILKQVGLFDMCWFARLLLITDIFQVWGEMHFFTCDWVIWANGHHVIFMVKTGAHEMTCSCPIPWTDNHILWAILGFTLASIDAKMDQVLMEQIIGVSHSNWPNDPCELVQDLPF